MEKSTENKISTAKPGVKSAQAVQMEKHMRRHLSYLKNECQDAIIGMLNPEFVECDPERRTATLSFDYADWMRNPGRTMHGGLISTAFDSTFGLLTNYYSRGHFITTTNLSISFLEPVFPGDKLYIRVKASRAGRTLVNLTGKAYAEGTHGRRLADTATATFMILKEQFILPEEPTLSSTPSDDAHQG